MPSRSRPVCAAVLQKHFRAPAARPRPALDRGSSGGRPLRGPMAHRPRLGCAGAGCAADARIPRNGAGGRPAGRPALPRRPRRTHGCRAGARRRPEHDAVAQARPDGARPAWGRPARPARHARGRVPAVPAGGTRPRAGVERREGIGDSGAASLPAAVATDAPPVDTTTATVATAAAAAAARPAASPPAVAAAAGRCVAWAPPLPPRGQALLVGGCGAVRGPSGRPRCRRGAKNCRPGVKKC